MSENSRTICIDFDGVIAKYDVWKGSGKFGEPIEGVQATMERLKEEGWTIIIHTTRGETALIERYLEKHNIPYHHINYNPSNFFLNCSDQKPLADVYLDDRAIQFNGDWKEAYEQIAEFKPWYKR